MSIFNRLFKIGQAEAHSVVDKMEDPVKMTEQGIRDLKADLDKSMQAFAEVKAMSIRYKRESETYRAKAQEYEMKAVQLVQGAQSGKVPIDQADRLASEALAQKAQNDQLAATAEANVQKFEANLTTLDNSIKKLKSNITHYENELRTLKARATVSKATQNVNKQLAGIDSSSTVSMLERMKERVEKQEALSEAYGEMADQGKSIDEEINSALANNNQSDALAALKAKLALNSNNPPLQ